MAPARHIALPWMVMVLSFDQRFWYFTGLSQFETVAAAHERKWPHSLRDAAMEVS